MKTRIGTLVLASAVLLVPALARPATAEDFKLGVGGGPTFTLGDYADAYETGWHAMIRGLWLPASSPVGIRAAGYYGQNASKIGDFFGVSIKPSSLYGGDLDAAVRLTGKGAEGLYAFGGVGVRSIRQEASMGVFGTTSQTNTNVSFNGGLGYSVGWFFAEANAVYFKVEGSSLWSIPVSIGFQF